MALDARNKGCSDGAPEQCESLAQNVFTLKELTPDGPYSMSNRAALAAAQTDAQCAAGKAMACLIHIDILSQRTDGISFGVARAMQNGASLADATSALKSKEKAYVQHAETLAESRNSALRTQCAANEKQACDDLGLFLSWYGKLRNSRYEHLTYLFDACTNESPTACNPLISGVMEIATFAEADGAAPLEPWRAKLEQGCDAQNLTLCYFLVLVSEFDETQDTAALEAQICDMGSSMTCSRIGQRLLQDYAKTNAPETLGRATDVLTRACDLKDHYACHILEHLSKG